MKSKSIFNSKTILATIAFCFATFISPAISRYLDTGTWTAADTKDTAAAILVVATSAALRYSTTDTVYTPHGVIGRDKPEPDAVDETEVFY